MIEAGSTLGRRSGVRRVPGATGDRAPRASRLRPAFGEVISETGTWPDEVPFGYQSNWLAPPGLTLPDGTQLYLTKTRVYDPREGRFLQRDFRRTPGENAYVYARNDPVNVVDAAGMAYCPIELKDLDEVDLLRLLYETMVKGHEAGFGTEGFKEAVAALKQVAAEFERRGIKDTEGDPIKLDAAVREFEDKGFINHFRGRGHDHTGIRQLGKLNVAIEDRNRQRMRGASRKERRELRKRMKSALGMFYRNWDLNLRVQRQAVRAERWAARQVRRIERQLWWAEWRSRRAEDLRRAGRALKRISRKTGLTKFGRTAAGVGLGIWRAGEWLSRKTGLTKFGRGVARAFRGEREYEPTPWDVSRMRLEDPFLDIPDAPQSWLVQMAERKAVAGAEALEEGTLGQQEAAGFAAGIFRKEGALAGFTYGAQWERSLTESGETAYEAKIAGGITVFPRGGPVGLTFGLHGTARTGPLDVDIEGGTFGVGVRFGPPPPPPKSWP